jgi:hypothetical protein
MKRLQILIASFLLTGCVAGTTESGPPSQAATALPTSTAPSATIDPTAAPVGSGTAYSLDCGALKPSPCEKAASELIETYARRYPNSSVVNITFMGQCGSFQMRFDDGSGVGGDIDCIVPSPSG